MAAAPFVGFVVVCLIFPVHGQLCSAGSLFNTSFSPLPFLTQYYGSTKIRPTGGSLGATPYVQLTDGPQQSGNIRLHLSPTVPTPIYAFRATFEAFLHGGHVGADGFGFFFSNLPSGLYASDEHLGSGSGLLLSFLTAGSPGLQIVYGSTLRRQVPYTFRSGASWKNYTVEMTATGYLTVTFDENYVVQDYQIPGWSPLFTWVFGFGGYCGNLQDSGQYMWDNQAVRSLSISGCTNFTLPQGSGPWYCAGNLDAVEPTGTIFPSYQAPVYTPGQSCSWRIAPSVQPGHVSLTFPSFSTEGGFDIVRIYEGQDDTAPLVGTFSGDLATPFTVTSSSNVMFVTWVTDGGLQRAGFTANYAWHPPSSYNCTGLSTLTAANGSFVDHTGPGAHISNLNCRWLIQLPDPNTVVELAFTSFSIVGPDFVAVYDGSSELAPLIGNFSGSALPPTLTSGGSTLVVQLRSFGSQHGQGFSVRYSSRPSSIYCASQSSIVAAQPPVAFWSNVAPGTYRANSSCTWNFEGPAATVWVTFTSVVTEPGRDSVAVFDGPNVTSATFGAFSGTPYSFTLQSTGPSMTVRFTSDAVIQLPGFVGTYESVPRYCAGVRTIRANSGAIVSHMGGGPYAANSACGWLLQPPPGPSNNVFLAFERFASEQAADWVYIYNGDTATAPLLANYSGREFPAPVMSSSLNMFVRFVSNAAVEDTGFVARFSSVPYHCAGHVVVTAPAGYLYEHSIDWDYRPNGQCSWHLKPDNATAASVVLLRFTRFASEQWFDFLRLYDGNSTSAPLLNALHGQSYGMPMYLHSTGPSLFLTWNTDGGAQRSGFLAYYDVVPERWWEWAVPIASLEGGASRSWLFDGRCRRRPSCVDVQSGW